MKIVVVRHGKSKHNLGDESKHIFAGNSIDDELAEEGVSNARQLAKKINELGGYDNIFCSNLKRSVETAEIINKELQKNIELTKIFELREIDIGDFASHTEEEVKRFFPEAAKAFYDGDIEKWDFPNGENYSDVKLRIETGLEIIKDKSSDSNQVLFCGHGMLNRIVFYLFNNRVKNLWQKRNYPHDKIVMISI